MRSRTRLLAVVGSLFAGAMVYNPAWAATETKGFFCSNCVDFESARQQAIEYAAPLSCSGDGLSLDPDSGLECFAPDRRVVLGNHLTGQVFAFIVTRDSDSPWAASADEFMLSPAEHEAYRKTLNFRKDWEALVAQGIELPPQLLIQDEGDDCPQGTALDAYFDNGRQKDIRAQISADVSAQLQEYKDNTPWFRKLSDGLTFGMVHKGVGVRLAVPGSDNVEWVFAFTFQESEVGNLFNIPDRLVYEVVELAGMDGAGNTILSIDLREDLSRVAGAELDQFLSGKVDITNECVLTKLGHLDDNDSGSFRLGGALVDPNASFGTGGSSGGASGGSTTKMCIFDFFVNGRYQHSFTAPCDSADGDKEEIK